MPKAAARTETVREACIAEALAIIEREGVEALSLREVARRLGVSHQAPYKHFASRDHLLAEVVSRAFVNFARCLDARPRNDDPALDLASMGHAYLDFAQKHPLQYRLMFGTPLPDKNDHPEMMRNGRHAFSILVHALAVLHTRQHGLAQADAVTLDAMFVWATMHGTASIIQTSALDSLDLSPGVLANLGEHMSRRIGAALGGNPGPTSQEHPEP